MTLARPRSPTPRNARRRSTSSTTSAPGISFYAKTSANPGVNELADLCGKTVAVEKGTVEQEEAEAQSKKCTKEGKKSVTVLSFPGQNAVNLAVSSGRADLGMADSPVVAYQIKQSNGQFKLIGKSYALRALRARGAEDERHDHADPGGAEGADGQRQVPRRSSPSGASSRARSTPRRSTARTAERANGVLAGGHRQRGTARGDPGRPRAPPRAAGWRRRSSW